MKRMPRNGTCLVQGCGKVIRARGLCEKHYKAARAEAARTNLCACGCGQLTQARFVSGHNTRLLPDEEQQRRGRMNDGSAKRDRGSGKCYRKVRQRHEHRLVMEQALGRKLGPDEVVHHVNGNKRDNRLENLRVMSRREHILEHLDEMKRLRFQKLFSDLL